MPSLHLISSEKALAECLSIAAREDSLLVMGRAAGVTRSDLQRPVFVLADDVSDASAVNGAAKLIDYAGFVELVVTHRPIITWR